MARIKIKEKRSHKSFTLDLERTLIAKVVVKDSKCTLQSRALSELLEISDTFKTTKLVEHKIINTLTIENVEVKVINYI